MPKKDNGCMFSDISPCFVGPEDASSPASNFSLRADSSSSGFVSQLWDGGEGPRPVTAGMDTLAGRVVLPESLAGLSSASMGPISSRSRFDILSLDFFLLLLFLFCSLESAISVSGSSVTDFLGSERSTVDFPKSPNSPPFLSLALVCNSLASSRVVGDDTVETSS